jgi:hypothetical protein
MEETSKRGSYISYVVKNKYYDYYNIKHRVAVCKMDAVAKRLTYIWAKVATSKTFKFYSSHEIDAVEVMEDIRAKWVDLNCNEILRKCIVPMVRDGYALLELIKKDESLDYEVYGEYECPPTLWIRRSDNKILAYKIQYTPKPRGLGSSASMLQISTRGIDNLRMVNKTKNPREIIHMEYGEANYGLGMPLIEGAWDPIMKLVGVSHQEMLDRRSIPTLHLLEDDYDENHTKAKDMLTMVANSDQDTARLWYHPENAKGEILEYPKFAYESPTTNPNYSNRNEKSGISTGDYGNVSSEWTRLTTVTGHTINYFMGNRAGAVVGSETDKESDDEQETIDFAQIEIIIRKILEWLDSKDIITLPKESFVIKYWKDWEHIELWKDYDEKQDEKDEDETETSDSKETAIDQQDNKPDVRKEEPPANQEEKLDFKILKIPVLDYNLIDSIDTETKIKKLGNENEWSMGTGTATNIKRMLESLKSKANKHQLRINTMTAEAFGNSIKENHPLQYDIGDGVIVEEFICPDSWKKNVGKTVPLGVYHNLDYDNTPELPKWQIVGNAEVFGWDDLDGEDYVKYNYDYDKIDSVFQKLNQYDWLTPALKENGTSDISTAYYCDIEHRWNDKLGKVIRIQVNIKLMSISFVPKGNCPGEVCSIAVVKANMGAMQTYIKNCLAEGQEKSACLASAYKLFKAKT